jgi:peptide/nickel transport system substrate-binding protein
MAAVLSVAALAVVACSSSTSGGGSSSSSSSESSSSSSSSASSSAAAGGSSSASSASSAGSSAAGGSSSAGSSSASGGTGGVPAPQTFPAASGGTYHWALSIAITSMDPQTTGNVYDYIYLWPTYDRLTYLDTKTGQARPMLAKSWEVAADGKSITLQLRTDVTYQDGTKFDAQSVKDNFNRMMTNPASTVKGQITNIDNVQVVDPATVKINMKGATAGPMPQILGGFPGTMVSPKSFDDPNLKSIGVGAGPYKVVSNDGTNIKYVKYDGYYNKAAQTVDEIDATALPDDQTRLNSVISGQEDAVLIRGNQIDSAKSAGLTVVQNSAPTPNALEINMSRAQFGNLKVRQAIQYALNRPEIATAAFGANCTPNQQIFAKTYWAYDKNLTDPYPFNLDKAKALMKEAGLENGFSFTITSPNIPAWVTMITAIQDELKQINIDVKLNVVAGSAGNAVYWVQHAADALTSADPFLLDPSTMIQQYWGPGGGRNVTNFSDPQINDLAAKALATSDQAQRTDYYNQIQKIVSDQALNPFVICNQTSAWALKPGVQGFQVATTGIWDYSEITVPKS